MFGPSLRATESNAWPQQWPQSLAVKDVFRNPDDGAFYELSIRGVGTEVTYSISPSTETTSILGRVYLNPDDSTYYELTLRTIDGVVTPRIVAV